MSKHMWICLVVCLLSITGRQRSLAVPIHASDCEVLRQWPAFVKLAKSAGADYSTCQPSLPSCLDEYMVCDNDGHIQQLQLLDQNLTGTLPAVLGQLSNLQSLALSNNEFVSTLPPEWGQLNKLYWLSCSYNKNIYGTIPASWVNMVAMEQLVMSWNYLSGTLPSWISKWENLTGIFAVSNRFTGSLPAEWNKLPNLIGVVLQNNRLTGKLPSSWKDMPAIINLNLGGNWLTGTLPGEWSAAKTLHRLNVARTYIQGSIPASWAPTTGVFTLFISVDSGLCGAVPTGINITRLIDPLTSYSVDGSIVNRLPPCTPGGLLVTLTGQCGPFNKKRCPAGMGCSLAGWCGKTDEHRNPYKGCQDKYGDCSGSKVAVTTDGFCGLPSSKRSCPVGLCCNSKGVCRGSNVDCKPSNGCQSKYGMCYEKGNPFSYQQSAGAGGDIQVVYSRDINGTENQLLADRCGLLASFRTCINYKVTDATTTVDTLAAAFGTSPYQIILDNMVYAPGLVSFHPGSILAIRPADAPEDRRWSPNRVPYAGALDNSYPRPCSGAPPQEQARCFCSYHRDGSYVWPFNGKCDTLILCSGAAFDRFEKCGPKTVADEGDEFNGQSMCIPKPDNFVCSDGCSSMFCFCKEYLLNNGLYLNPFDSTRRTAIQCDWKEPKGWFGGLVDCGAGRYFHPTRKQCTDQPMSHIPYRRGFTSCDGIPDPDANPLPTTVPGRTGRRLQAFRLFPVPALSRPCNRLSCCNKARYARAKFFGCVPCSNQGCRDGRAAFLHIVSSRNTKCLCGVYGACPTWFNKNCRWRKRTVVG